MKLARVIEAMERIAPESMAEPWDKVGLQVGDPQQPVTRALICIDLTEAVMAEAVKVKCNLIVAYHPPIFAPVERLTTRTWKERVLREAVRRSVAIYSPHTALDAAAGGVNDWLADALGPGERRAIRPHREDEGTHKLVTFVPPEYVDAVRTAMSGAGAGVIGAYTQCSFTSPGVGTFVGGAESSPTIGRRGRLETVDELRIEMLVPGSKIAAAVEALRRSHPYEEPAFDLVPLASRPVSGAVGQGRVVTLVKPMTVSTLSRRVAVRLGLKRLEIAGARSAGSRQVRRVGVCVGAGGSLWREAGDVDAYVTGEMRHHDVLDAVQRGQTVLLAGHTQTERPYLPTYRDRLVALKLAGVSWRISAADER